MVVEVYSDVACPWCYIGHRRFSRALDSVQSEEPIEVVFRPYQLDPTLTEEPIPLPERLERKFGGGSGAMIEQVTRTGETEGIEFHFDRALAVNTLAAHRLLRLAEEEYGAETQRRLAEELFAAHFTHGKNIADAEVLTQLAVSAGLDRDRVGAYLSSGEGVRDVQEEIASAQQLGIRAVPTFVFEGKYAVQGGQPTETFVKVLAQVLSDEAAAESD